VYAPYTSSQYAPYTSQYGVYTPPTVYSVYAYGIRSSSGHADDNENGIADQDPSDAKNRQLYAPGVYAGVYQGAYGQGGAYAAPYSGRVYSPYNNVYSPYAVYGFAPPSPGPGPRNPADQCSCDTRCSEFNDCCANYTTYCTTN